MSDTSVKIGFYQVGGAYQCSIEEHDSMGCVSGYRLSGPKFDGSSALLRLINIGAHEAREIRRVLDKHFPESDQ